MTSVHSITLNEITSYGEGLVRPECVIATRNGDLYAINGGGGVTHITPNSEANVILANNDETPNDYLPNGYSQQPDGSFLVTNLDQSGQIMT